MNHTEMLTELARKLEIVENRLYECLTSDVVTNIDQFLKAHELWLTAQNQLRLTANQLNSAKPEKKEAPKPIGSRSNGTLTRLAAMRLNTK